MLKECIEVFQHLMQKTNNRLVLDTHIPADGTYLIIDSDGNIKEQIEIKKDKKTKEIDMSSPYFPELRIYDYNSILVTMNKPVDPKKIIHSNNYLSFAIKKDSLVTGKLTEKNIDDYYDILENPLEKKYSKSKAASQIYKQFEESEGKPDIEKIAWIKTWIKNNIFTLENIDLSQKDYLKIYFEAEQTEYERENKRYLLPNIYNSNDYNIIIEDEIYGMPNDNLGMNAKKPFLSIKTRKNPAPYLVTLDEVILQKQFFDYLMNLVSSGKYHIFIDTTEQKIQGIGNDGETPGPIVTGYYLNISKGKNEAEINEQDNIANYSQTLKKPFVFKNILNRHNKRSIAYDGNYKVYDQRASVGQIIDEVFFSKWLKNNYKGEPNIKDEKLRQNILQSRDVIFDWIYKGIDCGMAETIERAGFTAIKNTLLNDYTERVLYQFNLLWSFRMYFSNKEDDTMAEFISELDNRVRNKVKSDHVIAIENDDEYFYCVGQLAKYLLSLSKAKDKNHALLNPIINAKNDAMLKKRISQMYKKYDYSISTKYKRTENLIAMVMGYAMTGKVKQEMIILGYACDSVLFDKKESEGGMDNE